MSSAGPQVRATLRTVLRELGKQVRTLVGTLGVRLVTWLTAAIPLSLE